MIEQRPEAFIMHEQFDDASDQAQLGACRAAREHLPQPTIAPRMRDERAPKFRQHRDSDGNESEHPGPRLEATDACFGKTEEAFRISKAFFTGEASRIFGSHPRSRQVAVRQQVPETPPPARVTRSRLHQKNLSRIALDVPDAPPCTTALILRPAQGIEPAPAAFNSHMVARLRANDVRDAQFI